MLEGNFCTVYTKAHERRKGKWHGSVKGVGGVPIDKVWDLVSQTSRLTEWMPMVENCTRLAGEEGNSGYVRLVSGLRTTETGHGPRRGWFSWSPQRSAKCTGWKQAMWAWTGRSICCDSSIMGEDTTLVDWSLKIDPVEGASEDGIMDYLGVVYKSCINRIEGAIKSSFRKERESRSMP